MEYLDEVLYEKQLYFDKYSLWIFFFKNYFFRVGYNIAMVEEYNAKELL
jgi:hypothetical protein